MKKILVIAGHPDLNTDSVGNKLILEGLEKEISDITIHKLAELYPDYKFDIEKEQKLLVEHDIIVFQFPFFWYSLPALMKKWLDDVFTYGFSHGTSEGKLKGKKILFSLTTGAPAAAYTHEGLMRHTIDELLYPLDTVAVMTGMDKIGVVSTEGISYAARTNGLEASPEVAEKIKLHIDKVVEILKKQ